MTNEKSSPSDLARGLFVGNVKEAFERYLEQLYDFWVPMLQKSTLPADISYTDSRVQEAFKALDAYMAMPRDASRLGSIQFTRFLSALQDSIKLDRSAGRVFPA